MAYVGPGDRVVIVCGGFPAEVAAAVDVVGGFPAVVAAAVDFIGGFPAEAVT